MQLLHNVFLVDKLLSVNLEDRRSYIKLWIDMFGKDSERLQATSGFIDQLLSLEQYDVLIDVAWEVFDQIRSSLLLIA